jgi:hypothetical protein
LTSWFSLPGELRAPIFCFVRRARKRGAQLVSRPSVSIQRHRTDSGFAVRRRDSPGARVSRSSARSAHAAHDFSQHPVLVPFSLRSSLQFWFLLLLASQAGRLISCTGFCAQTSFSCFLRFSRRVLQFCGSIARPCSFWISWRIPRAMR